MARLQAQQVPTNPHLPVTYGDEEASLRDPGHIVERMRGLVLAQGRAILAHRRLPHDRFLARMQEFGGEEFMTPMERDFAMDPSPDPHAVVQFHWRIEAIYALQWALGWWGTMLRPDEVCSLDDVLHKAFDHAELASPKRRPVGEILDAFDEYYRLHWACVDARLNSRELPQVDDGIVLERRHALQWLCDPEDDWDNVSLDT